MTDMARPKLTAKIAVSTITDLVATVNTSGTHPGWKKTIKTWTIQWGDGSHDAGTGTPSPMLHTHTYPAIGDYPATLRVTDSAGAILSATAVVSITSGNPPQPVVSVTVAGPTSGTVGQSLSYTARATYSDNSTVDVTPVATWASSVSVATVSSPGVIAAASAGSAQITATYNAVASSPVTLVITTPPAPPALPSTPSLPNPATAAAGVALSPTLQWTSTGATTYTVKFGTNSPPPQVATGVTASGYATGTLATGTIYFWQIVAVNASGSTTGPIWTFTSASAPPPPPPPSTLVVTAPTVQTITSSTGQAVAVTYAATASGGTPPIQMAYSPTSGSLFSVGTTVVTATAIDSGTPPQTAQTTFPVTVTYTPIPATCQDPLASNYGGPAPCVYLTTDPTIGPDPVEPLLSAALFSRVKSPAQQMHFTAGLPLRFFADALTNDEYLYATNTGVVRFYVDAGLVGTVGLWPGELNHWEYRHAVGLTAGTHTLTMDFTPHAADPPFPRPTYPGAVAITLHVDALPVKTNPTIHLTADVVLTGSTALNWTDVVVYGHGFTVTAAGGYSGNVTISNAFVTGLGDYGLWGMNITTIGNLSITDSIFEATAAMRLLVNGSGTVTVRDNEWRANNLVTYSSPLPDASHTLELSANTSATPLFKGNNVGFGTMNLIGGSNWDIGGTTAAESNVLMGPRCFLRVDNTINAHVQGNYLHHEYKNGASQGFCLFMSGSLTPLVENNLICEGSWPLQDVAGEIRYNVIIDMGGHDFWRSARPGASFHHNIVSYVWYSPNLAQNGAVFLYQGETMSSIHHNTLDMGGPAANYTASMFTLSGGATITELHSNVFAGLTGSTAIVSGPAPSTADHNGEYRDAADPHFVSARDVPYKIQEGRIWNRDVSVFDVLAYYRSKYTPATGSPLLGSGRNNSNQGAIDFQPTIPPVVGSTHPRLWLTSGLLTALKAKAAASDADWLALKATADTLLTYSVPAFQPSGGPSNAILYDYQGGGWYDAIQVLALAYQITGTATYATKVKDIVAVMTAPLLTNDLRPISTDSGYPSRSAAAGLALAYDWCYDQLDGTTKTSIYNTMNAWFDWYKANAFNKDGPAYGNYFGGHLLGFGLCGLATSSENSRGVEIRDYIRTLFNNTVAAEFQTGVFQGGYPVEGYVYGTNHFIRLLQYMIGIKTATGEDLITGSGYGQKLIRSLIYNRKPNRWQYPDEADYAGDQTGILVPNLLMMLPSLTAGTTESQWAQWFFQHRATPPVGETLDSFTHFVWYDSALASTDYSLTQPLVSRSPGDGHVIVRSSWADTAVWTSFKAGARFLGGHASRAAGHFAIQRGNDYLLVNSGQWKGPNGYSGNPQVFDGRSWRLNTLWYQNPYSIEYQGAQGYWGSDAILATQDTANYSYTKADLTSAYTANIPTGLAAFTRTVVTLASGVSVVFDRIRAGLSTDLKKLVWHVNPNGTRSVAGNVFDTGVIGSSRLYIQTLGALLTPQLSVVSDPLTDTDATPTTYRLEVTEGATTTVMDVFTVFQPVASTVTSAPVASFSTTSSTRVVTVDGKAITFALNGDLQSVA